MSVGGRGRPRRTEKGLECVPVGRVRSHNRFEPIGIALSGALHGGVSIGSIGRGHVKGG